MYTARDGAVALAVECSGCQGDRCHPTSGAPRSHPQESSACDGWSSARRAEYLRGRSTARRALECATQDTLPTHSASMANSHHDQPWVDRGEFGQPVLREAGPWAVSLAHAGPCVAALVHDCATPLGLDVEMISERTLSIASRTFQTPAHAIGLHDLTPIRTWTAAEALSKAIRTGFTINTELLESSIVSRDGDVAHHSYAHFPQYAALTWREGSVVFAIAAPRRLVTSGQFSPLTWPSPTACPSSHTCRATLMN